MNKLKVGIIGTGNIGTDLLIKTLKSDYLECTLFSGRNLSSIGMSKAVHLGVNVSDEGIVAFSKNPHCCDLVFDATSAVSHKQHSTVFQELGITAIDLTPAKVGKFCVPLVNLDECLSQNNLNMVTCGGQSSIPILSAVSKLCNIEYVELVSTISSRSAGPGTRINIDEYVYTTEKAIKQFSGAKECKVILNLNPAVPNINMRTTFYIKSNNYDLDLLSEKIEESVADIINYVPGYKLLVKPTIQREHIFLTVEVKGKGDYLPSYAGNLDIINSAAIMVAEEFAKRREDEK